MPSTASLTLNDYDGQPGIVGINVEEVTAANITAVATAMGNWRGAIEAITLGITIKSQLSILSRFNASNARATSNLAQRGNKWIVFYRDNSQFLDAGNTVPNPGFQRAFTLDIPTADLSFRTAQQDVVWAIGSLTNPTEFDDLVTAGQALVKSPYSGDILVERVEATTRAGG